LEDNPPANENPSAVSRWYTGNSIPSQMIKSGSLVRLSILAGVTGTASVFKYRLKFSKNLIIGKIKSSDVCFVVWCDKTDVLILSNGLLGFVLLPSLQEVQ